MALPKPVVARVLTDSMMTGVCTAQLELVDGGEDRFGRFVRGVRQCAGSGPCHPTPRRRRRAAAPATCACEESAAIVCNIAARIETATLVYFVPRRLLLVAQALHEFLSLEPCPSVHLGRLHSTSKLFIPLHDSQWRK